MKIFLESSTVILEKAAIIVASSDRRLDREFSDFTNPTIIASPTTIPSISPIKKPIFLFVWILGLKWRSSSSSSCSRSSMCLSSESADEMRYRRLMPILENTLWTFSIVSSFFKNFVFGSPFFQLFNCVHTVFADKIYFKIKLIKGGLSFFFSFFFKIKIKRNKTKQKLDTYGEIFGCRRLVF